MRNITLIDVERLWLTDENGAGLEMVRERCTEEQTTGLLQAKEAGTTVAGLCREYGIRSPMNCNWQAKDSRVAVSEL